jgi:FkbM family methyltransferase
MSNGPDQSLKNRVRERAKLAVRGGLHRLDLDVSRGIFTRQVARTLESRGIDTVLDVGANVGQYALGLRRSGYAGRIISCEPLSGAYGELSRRAAKDPHWHTVNAAVGREPGETDINVAANSYSSSILGMTQAHLDGAPDSAYVAVERVEVTTVAALAEKYAVEPARTLLKIDTQGYEAEVMAGAGDLLGRFDGMQLEVSFVELYEGQQLAEQTIAVLREHGYRLQSLETGFSDPTGRLLQCDVLVVRDH